MELVCKLVEDGRTGVVTLEKAQLCLLASSGFSSFIDPFILSSQCPTSMHHNKYFVTHMSTQWLSCVSSCPAEIDNSFCCHKLWGMRSVVLHLKQSTNSTFINVSTISRFVPALSVWFDLVSQFVWKPGCDILLLLPGPEGLLHLILPQLQLPTHCNTIYKCDCVRNGKKITWPLPAWCSWQLTAP